MDQRKEQKYVFLGTFSYFITHLAKVPGNTKHYFSNHITQNKCSCHTNIAKIWEKNKAHGIWLKSESNSFLQERGKGDTQSLLLYYSSGRNSWQGSRGQREQETGWGLRWGSREGEGEAWPAGLTWDHLNAFNKHGTSAVPVSPDKTLGWHGQWSQEWAEGWTWPYRLPQRTHLQSQPQISIKEALKRKSVTDLMTRAQLLRGKLTPVRYSQTCTCVMTPHRLCLLKSGSHTQQTWNTGHTEQSQQTLPGKPSGLTTENTHFNIFSTTTSQHVWNQSIFVLH